MKNVRAVYVMMKYVLSSKFVSNLLIILCFYYIIYFIIFNNMIYNIIMEYDTIVYFILLLVGIDDIERCSSWPLRLALSNIQPSWQCYGSRLWYYYLAHQLCNEKEAALSLSIRYRICVESNLRPIMLADWFMIKDIPQYVRSLGRIACLLGSYYVFTFLLSTYMSSLCTLFIAKVMVLTVSIPWVQCIPTMQFWTWVWEIKILSALIDWVHCLIRFSVLYQMSACSLLFYSYNVHVYSYLSGRTRLEPVAIVILSAIMSVASVQLIAESIQTIVSIAQEKATFIDFDNVTIGVLAATMCKFWFLVWKLMMNFQMRLAYAIMVIEIVWQWIVEISGVNFLTCFPQFS